MGNRISRQIKWVFPATLAARRGGNAGTQSDGIGHLWGQWHGHQDEIDSEENVAEHHLRALNHRTVRDEPTHNAPVLAEIAPNSSGM